MRDFGTEERHLREEIIEFSRMLVERDLLEYKGGNLSVRLDDDSMLVTRRGMRKGIPSQGDIIRTLISSDDEGAAVASSALEVHRAIYQKTDARAVVHAHPSNVVSLSFFMDEFRPIDENGLLYLGRSVRIVPAPSLFGWNLAAEQYGDSLIECPVTVEKWHGTFARGLDLGEAFHRTRAVEFSASHLIRVRQLTSLFGEPVMPPEQEAEVLGGIATRGLKKIW